MKRKSKADRWRNASEWPREAWGVWEKIQVRDRWGKDNGQQWNLAVERREMFPLVRPCENVLCKKWAPTLLQTQPPTPPVHPPIHPPTYTQSHILMFPSLPWTLHWLRFISERVTLLPNPWLTLTKCNPKCNNVQGLSDLRRKMTPHNMSNTSAQTPLCGHLTMSSFSKFIVH